MNNSIQSVKVKNAHFALVHARKMFYKSPTSRNRQFTLTLADFLKEEVK